ncbi:SH3 domain-containing protein [Pontibaca salina]|uniref:SH3 domain-containing protein n=1 Tax=Pontibaca salina TaxID=2795731 RepID=A0A934HSM1_9RHOB|nr:hypothetical protein [Pontibaca salina]MBI6630667.1 hypothetical protein [Pontibaca salina]
MVYRTLAIAVSALVLAAPAAQADLDGHGPDAWRVTGVAANDMLNVRMGPGTNYKVIERFAPNERGLQQITCVPFYQLRHYSEMSEAEIKALPAPWCLVRAADMTRAGWVSQRFIEPDHGQAAAANAQETRQAAATAPAGSLINGAENLVRDLYNAFERSASQADNPFMRPAAKKYFTTEMIPDLAGHGADLLYDAQDFQGSVTRIAPDPQRPMFRGMISINVDFTNFGRPSNATFYLRADTGQPGAPFRIFRIEHENWSFPP